jgi:hypothetical protein
MWGYRHQRIKIVLLSLGVVLGYGSALAHFAWHRHHGGWHHGCDDVPWSAPNTAAPAAPQGGAPSPKAP